jgi:hypothetical protein
VEIIYYDTSEGHSECEVTMGVVKDKMIFGINKNIASGNPVLRELLSSLIRAIQARYIYTIESLL